MNRPYLNLGDSLLPNPQGFFVGTEVENSKFKGQKTLFVPIVLSLGQIDLIRSQADLNNCTHVYLGANKLDKAYDWALITCLLTSYNVTLDVTSNNKEVLSSVPWGGLCEKRFNLMLSVEVPNAVVGAISIKLDDIGFNATNPGVWVAQANELEFTSWDQYTKDKLL